jgi:hypothetical protein
MTETKAELQKRISVAASCIRSSMRYEIENHDRAAVRAGDAWDRWAEEHWASVTAYASALFYLTDEDFDTILQRELQAVRTVDAAVVVAS